MLKISDLEPIQCKFLAAIQITNDYHFISTNAYFDSAFTSMLEKFEKMIEDEENRTEEAAEDLPPENDFGNVEYKLKLCNLTMYKVKKRTT